jgi:DNA repair protein RecO (recombination protein O)
MPLTPAALGALRYIIGASPKRFLSFDLSGDGLHRLADLAEAYLMTQLERGFRTLDFYKSIRLD